MSSLAFLLQIFNKKIKGDNFLLVILYAKFYNCIHMDNSRRNFSIVLVLFLILAAIFFYPSYSKWSAKRAELAVQKSFTNLSRLVLDEHDCPKAITEAKSFLLSNSKATPILSILGACQFDTGSFADAKVTFEKVLSLEPENAAAKNYLKRMEFKDGEVMVTSGEVPINRLQFESAIGANFDDVLTFGKAARKISNIEQYLLASYTTSEKRADVIAALKAKLEATGLPVTVSETDTATIIAAGNDKEIKIIQMSKGNVLITIGMNYQKLQ